MPRRILRRDEEWLRDMIAALDAVMRFTSGKTFEEFMRDEPVCDLVVRRLTIVGEAASRATAALRKRHPEVAWATVVSFRNVLVHDYFGIHWPIVWATAVERAPALREQIAAIFLAEFPDRPMGTP